MLLPQRAGVAFLLFIVCLATGLWNAYADQVILTNGDRISGRLVSYSRETLHISTSYSGIIEIDLGHLLQLDTDNTMVVELLSGERIIGRIGSGEAKKIIIHSSVLGDRELSLSMIASIEVSVPHKNVNEKALQGDIQNAVEVAGTTLSQFNNEKNNLSIQLQDLRGKGADSLKAQDETTKNSTGASNQTISIGAKPEDEEDIRRIFLRQSSVLLKSGEKEVELDFNYLGNQLSSSIYNAKFRQFQLPIALRIGIFDRGEGFVSFPVIRAKQEISFADNSITQKTSGIGDALIGINYEIFRETTDWPDVVTSLSIRAPTGRVPGEQGLSTGSGHWTGSFGAQFIKTADPVVLFWGIRYAHEFPSRHFLNDGVYDVRPGETIDYNFGFGFAVNDKVSLSTQTSGSYQWETKADGKKISGSSAEPVSLRSALTYRVSKKTYIEPSLTIGLTNETPDFVIGIATTHRFGN
jgi:hypothetical protein